MKGFRNPKNLCSFNSLSQCLFNLPLVRDFIEKIKVGESIKLSTMMPNTLDKWARFYNFRIEFWKSYKDALEKYYDNSSFVDLEKTSNNLVKPNNLRMLNENQDPKFLFEQIVDISMDSFGFWGSDLLEIRNNGLKELFGISSKYSRNTSESFILHFNTSKRYNLFRERKDTSGKYNKVALISLNQYLCVRFDINATKYKIPDQLDFTDYVITEGTYKYTLCSYIILVGNFHAIAVVKVDDKWMQCDDMDIRENDNRKEYTNEYYPILGFYSKTRS